MFLTAVTALSDNTTTAVSQGVRHAPQTAGAVGGGRLSTLTGRAARGGGATRLTAVWAPCAGREAEWREANGPRQSGGTDIEQCTGCPDRETICRGRTMKRAASEF